MATPGGSTINPGRLTMEMNVVWNKISENCYFEHKAVWTNLTIIFSTLMNKLKITIFHSKKCSYHRIFVDFGYVILTILSNERCWCGLYTFFSTSKSNFTRLLQNRAWSTVRTVCSWAKWDDIDMHLFTTVFRVLASWDGANIMDKYPTTVCSNSSDETDVFHIAVLLCVMDYRLILEI